MVTNLGVQNIFKVRSLPAKDNLVPDSIYLVNQVNNLVQGYVTSKKKSDGTVDVYPMATDSTDNVEVQWESNNW